MSEIIQEVLVVVMVIALCGGANIIGQDMADRRWVKRLIARGLIEHHPAQLVWKGTEEEV
jgi:hypothetical protein